MFHACAQNIQTYFYPYDESYKQVAHGRWELSRAAECAATGTLFAAANASVEIDWLISSPLSVG